VNFYLKARFIKITELSL